MGMVGGSGKNVVWSGSGPDGADVAVGSTVGGAGAGSFEAHALRPAKKPASPLPLRKLRLLTLLFMFINLSAPLNDGPAGRGPAVVLIVL
jgi:hypothetical protein